MKQAKTKEDANLAQIADLEHQLATLQSTHHALVKRDDSHVKLIADL